MEESQLSAVGKSAEFRINGILVSLMWAVKLCQGKNNVTLSFIWLENAMINPVLHDEVVL